MYFEKYMSWGIYINMNLKFLFLYKGGSSKFANFHVHEQSKGQNHNIIYLIPYSFFLNNRDLCAETQAIPRTQRNIVQAPYPSGHFN